MIGYFAISLAGHDKGQMYLIVGEEKDILFLADGNNRKMDMETIKGLKINKLLLKQL